MLMQSKAQRKYHRSEITLFNRYKRLFYIRLIMMTGLKIGGYGVSYPSTSNLPRYSFSDSWEYHLQVLHNEDEDLYSFLYYLPTR